MPISDRATKAWDAFDGHRLEHRRKYAALGMLLVLIQVAAPIYRSVEWIWNRLPFTLALSLPFSWAWITTPVGLFLLLLSARDRGVRGRLKVGYTFDEKHHYGYLTITNRPDWQTVRRVRAEYTQIDPALEYQPTLPIPLLLINESWDAKEPATLDVDLPPGRSQSYWVCDMGGSRVFFASAFKLELLQQRTRFVERSFLKYPLGSLPCIQLLSEMSGFCFTSAIGWTFRGSGKSMFV